LVKFQFKSHIYIKGNHRIKVASNAIQSAIHR